MSRFSAWLDARTGYRAAAERALHEPVNGGARWAYVFGSGLALVFAVQAATGVLLALYYSASAREAWGSVYYLDKHIPLGWWIRGLHHWGASAMMVLLVAHLGQVFVYGAYRPPREFGWWSGLALLALTLAFGLTGYLLPWDQRGYWATRVVTNLMGAMPVFGRSLQALLIGGNGFGNLTLTRFFGFHVFFLPAALVLVLVLHVIFFRRQGVTPHWSRSEEALRAETEPFWPRQLTYDLAFGSLAVALVAALTLSRHGAPLQPPSDPASNYVARPDWYFLWLFELLKFFPGTWEGVGVLLLAVLAALFLAALPLVDRAKSASPRERWPHFVVAFAIASGIGIATAIPLIEDARNPAVRIQEERIARETRQAFALAELGIPPGGAAELYRNSPRARGRKLFTENCRSCHTVNGVGGKSAPDLTGYLTFPWVRSMLVDPSSQTHFGRTRVSGMPPIKGAPRELDELARELLALRGPGKASAQHKEIFWRKGCTSCHAFDGQPARVGPSLTGYGSRAWVVGLIEDSGLQRYFGGQIHNAMPRFSAKLTHAEIEDLVTYLLPVAKPSLAQRSN